MFSLPVTHLPSNPFSARPTLLVMMLSLFTTLGFAQVKTSYPGVSYRLPAKADTAEFIGSIRHSFIGQQPPYNALTFTIWEIQQSESTEAREIDSLVFLNVTQNMDLLEKPTRTNCPRTFPGFVVTCVKAKGKQDSNIYFHDLFSIRKNGRSLWIGITRSNDPDFQKADVDAFIQSLTLDASRFSSTVEKK